MSKSACAPAPRSGEGGGESPRAVRHNTPTRLDVPPDRGTHEPRVFSYVVAVDSGFAPNPFYDWCTLACCKPSIRRTASVGDMILGLVRGADRIVYAMRASEVLSFDAYWQDERFVCKRPRMDGSGIESVGDNIYEPMGNGRFRQHPSRHSKPDGNEHEGTKRHDIGGKNALVSREFVYFGALAPKLPGGLGFLVVGRGHRCRFSAEEVLKVGRWFDRQPRGRHGAPAMLPTVEATP